MARRILIINGHPDAAPERLCAALCDAYAEGARAAGREVRRLNVGALDFPLVRSRQDFEKGALPGDIAAAQAAVKWADHLVIVHPLWLGAAPALLKAFFEQVFRYGFALEAGGGRGLGGLLKGRSARIIVTMGMPAFFYNLVFGAFGVRGFERGVLWISGFRPVRHTFLGGIGGASAEARSGWLAKARRLGVRGI